jgi:hypothetical protein
MAKKKEPKWKEFEKYVASLHDAFGEAQHDVKVKGIKSQIDAVCTKKEGIYSIKTFISCKYWNSNVKKQQVAELESIIKDCNANLGVIVSSKGFQSGAIEYAKAHGIKLLQIQELKPSDWEGMLQTINIDMDVLAPVGPPLVTVNCADETGKEPDNVSKEARTQLQIDEGILFNQAKKPCGNLIQDVQAAINTSGFGPGQHTVTREYPEPTFIIWNGVFKQIVSVTIDFELTLMKNPMTINFPKEYPVVLKDIIDGIEYPVSRHGEIRVKTSEGH